MFNQISNKGSQEADVTCSSALRRLLILLEQNGTVECCRAEAFHINVHDMTTWSEQENPETLGHVYTEVIKLATEDSSAGFINLKVRGLESHMVSN